MPSRINVAVRRRGIRRRSANASFSVAIKSIPMPRVVVDRNTRRREKRPWKPVSAHTVMDGEEPSHGCASGPVACYAPCGMPAPLAHLRVVDLTDLRGALAARLLADLGADVVKIEPPGGDPGRLRPPFAGGVPGKDRSLPFLYRNANKRGVTLDLHDAAGWRRFLGLCANADVLIETLGPDAARRHGLAPTEIRERHPHLVHVAIADFGLSGPRASWRLEALPAFAASGALYASGFPDRPPCWLPGYLAHDCASVFALSGTIAAVLDRTRHGHGQTVEVAVQEAALSGLNPWSIPLADYARLYPMLPVVPRRNADGAYYVLPTADGYVRALPGSPRQWSAFRTLLGDPEALAGPEWEVPLFRLLNVGVIRLLATDALAGRPRAEVPAEGRRPARGPHEQEGAGFPGRAAGPPAGGGTGPVLAGVRVIDLGVGVAIPECGWLLAELGAEVIKIESQANVDFLRRVTVEPDAPDRSWTFNDASRGHLSVCLDLRTPRGRALALDLCAASDVVIENNRGGVVRAWGLDYEDIRRGPSGTSYLAPPGVGRGGPLG